MLLLAEDFNLNILRSIGSTEPDDLPDIETLSRSGMPNRDVENLASSWDVFASARAKLFAQTARPGYRRLPAALADV